MLITKRNGASQPYNPDKIANAIRKSFAATGSNLDDETLKAIVTGVEELLETSPEVRTVEHIQDEVERALMRHAHYDEAKAYILYRAKRTEQRRAIQALAHETANDALAEVLTQAARDYSDEAYAVSALTEKFHTFHKPGMSPDESLAALTKAAVELTTPDAPRWEMIAARLLDHQLLGSIAAWEAERGLTSYYDKLHWLCEAGYVGSYLLEAYTADEIAEAATFMQPERDKLLTYSGLDLLRGRYLIRTHEGRPVERIQEMWLGIALHLAMNEHRNVRLSWVQRFYDLLSRLEATMATPTISGARKPFHQLSSCFIDTVPDSLEGIYRSIDNFAQVSKAGGGMGLYFGKVRAKGGRIRGFKGVAGGVIRWMKLVNDTAVAVDQLGMRQGAVAVYLDVWHKDLPEFLQLRTNNGDDRMKAHDIFPAVCYPDLFWRMAAEDLDQPWHLFCPNEILTVKGYALEDYWGEEWERRYRDCVADPRLSRRTLSIKDIIRLVLRSAVETGTPFTYNRDLVNRANPNAHQGIIYCSNLCTEIAQNMAPIQSLTTEVKTDEGDPIVVTKVKPGDFVVCNLASLSLGHLPLEDEGAMRDKVATLVRALDNVIDLNLYPLPYAEITNHAYRSIGLGISGYHHALALRGIKWESEEHLRWADHVMELINRAAIEASSDLAAEKGSYTYFEGSDWQTGAYFDKRSYTTPEWQHVREKVQHQGLRNAYLLAIAPTSSTGIIAGTTAGVDPVMNKFFLEEKKGAMLPRVAPDLSQQTYWYYKDAYHIDQTWSVRAAGIRQRHVDQAQSMNLYITNDYTFRQLLNLYLTAWREGVKTIYYVRSKSLEVEECESCAS